MSKDERLATKRLIELARIQALQMGAHDAADHLAQADLALQRHSVQVEFRASARDYQSGWTQTNLTKTQLN